MKGPVALTARIMASIAKRLGPYRVWRLLHEVRGVDVEAFDERLRYLLKEELPDRPLDQDFINYWLTDEMIVAAARQHSAQLGSVFYPVRVYHELMHICRELDHRPQQVLEIGPGFQQGCLFCFSASGVERACAIDIEPIKDVDEEFYETLAKYLAVSSGFDWWRRSAAANTCAEISHPKLWDSVEWREIYDRIEYQSPVSSDDIPFEEETFDFVYSITAYEHFPKPAETAHEIYRILKPGSLSVHEIDMRHHMDMRYHEPAEALKFLTWSEDKNDEVAEKYGEGKGLKNLVDGDWGEEVYCNRLRFSDYKDIFKVAGFEIVSSEPLEVLSKEAVDRDSFVEPFRSKSLDDLSVLVGRFVLRKPK